MQTRASFKGDQASHLDQLIASSQIKPGDVQPDQERALVPFFDSSESTNTDFEPLQGRRAAPPPAHHGLKRGAGERSAADLPSTAAAKKKENKQQAQQRAAAAAIVPRAPAPEAPPHQPRAAGAKAVRFAEPAAPRQAAQQPPAARTSKHQRKDSGKNLLALLTGGQGANAPTGQQQPGHVTPPPQRKRPEMQRFAGPAFSNSPVPESLPFPTPGLLMSEAAESLRSRLTL